MGGTYEDAAHQYVEYVGRHFGHPVTIVFDGYSNGPTIKNHEHDRRSMTSAPNTSTNPAPVDATKPAFGNQALAAFLANDQGGYYSLSHVTRTIRFQFYDWCRRYDTTYSRTWSQTDNRIVDTIRRYLVVSALLFTFRFLTQSTKLLLNVKNLEEKVAFVTSDAYFNANQPLV